MSGYRVPSIPPAELRTIEEAARAIGRIQVSPAYTALSNSISEMAVKQASVLNAGMVKSMNELSAAYNKTYARDFAKLLDAMPPSFDSIARNFAVALEPMRVNHIALQSMNDLLETFSRNQAQLFESMRPTFDIASLSGVTSLRSLVLPVLEELLAADEAELETIFRTKIAADSDVAAEVEPTEGDLPRSKPRFTPTMQQIWTLAWMMVLVMYVAALAGGGFSREELRTDVRAFAVGVMGALTVFGLFPYSRK